MLVYTCCRACHFCSQNPRLDSISLSLSVFTVCTQNHWEWKKATHTHTQTHTHTHTHTHTGYLKGCIIMFMHARTQLHYQTDKIAPISQSVSFLFFNNGSVDNKHFFIGNVYAKSPLKRHWQSLRSQHVGESGCPYWTLHNQDQM